MLLYRVCFKAGRLPALMEQNLKYQALAVLATRVHQSFHPMSMSQFKTKTRGYSASTKVLFSSAWRKSHWFYEALTLASGAPKHTPDCLLIGYCGRTWKRTPVIQSPNVWNGHSPPPWLRIYQWKSTEELYDARKNSTGNSTFGDSTSWDHSQVRLACISIWVF
jgi:hypothetical protein